MTEAEIYSLWIDFIAALISALSVLVAASAVIYGVVAWKREFVGKRRIELAENVLALFYEVQMAIREVRGRGGPFHVEGKTRKRADDEPEWASKTLDSMYITIERLQKREKLFSQFRSMKYRTMATLGTDTREPFDEIDGVLKRMRKISYELCELYTRDNYIMADRLADQEGRKTKELSKLLLEKLTEGELILYYHGDFGVREDEISQQVQQAVEKIEAIAEQYYSEYKQKRGLRKLFFWT